MPPVDASCRTEALEHLSSQGEFERLQPSIVVGVTHPQTCLVLVDRLRSLREAGFRVTLVSSPGELLSRTATAAGVEAIAIPMAREISPLADCLSLLRLCRLLRQIRPDMVEFSTPKAGLLGTLAAAFCGVPSRIYMLRGLKLETSSGLKRAVLWMAERVAAAFAHQVLCNSKSLRSEAAALRLAPAHKLRLLGLGSSNGVDMERFSPGPSAVRRRFGLSADDLVIGYVGRLTRDKGLPELIQAFEVIAWVEPNARLLLVGWFDESEDALDLALRAKIESHAQIRLTGFVPDAADYYRAMDLMVLPSLREGFPNCVLEAQSSGVPVVTTFSTGSRDAVVPEVTGLLVPPGYPQAIIEAVLMLLRQPDRRRRMSRSARAWVGEHFASSRVLHLTVDYYKGLLVPRTATAATQIN